jgi:hypothetical protein
LGRQAAVVSALWGCLPSVQYFSPVQDIIKGIGTLGIGTIDDPAHDLVFLAYTLYDRWRRSRGHRQFDYAPFGLDIYLGLPSL